MSWTLAEVRDAVFQQADWAPSQSPEGRLRANTLINRALKRLAMDCPFMFQAERSIVAEPDVKYSDGDSTNLLNLFDVLSTDAWVLEAQNVVGTMTVSWEDNRRWAARLISCRVQGTTDWHEFRIREITTVANKIRICLDRPWPNTTDTDIEWVIHTSEYVFQPDVLQVLGMMLKRADTFNRSLEIVGQGEAEDMSWATRTPDFLQTGPPIYAYRRPFEKIQKPRGEVLQAWTVPLSGTPVWNVKEATGEWRFVRTLVWGRRESWQSHSLPLQRDSAGGTEYRYPPVYESAHSPIPESAVTVPVGSGGSGGFIRVSFPSIDALLGFGESSMPRYKMSGYNTRIYGRLERTDNSTLREADDTFYLIAEVDGIETTYDFNGDDLLDLTVPLPEIQKQQTMRFWPTPDERYEVQVRCYALPERMADDDTAVPISNPVGIDALIARSLAYLYEMEGNLTGKADALSEYREAVHSLKKRQGSLRYPGKKRQRPIGRVRSRRWGNYRDRRSE